MNAFEWANAQSIDDAVKLLAPQGSNADPNADPDEAARPMGGGQDLLTTMKAYITRPPRVVNLKTIPGLGQITGDGQKGLTIGAEVTITQLADHPEVAKNYPGLVQAAHSIATPQIRNVGTVGGNLCQRPRCWYYRLENVKCLKKGGTECYAASGENKYNAILGGGPSYVVHPSDLAPMLVALGATVTIHGSDGTRDLPLEKFFSTPKTDLRRENVLNPGQIITEIHVPASAFAARSAYLKFKERASLDFAMSSVAAAAELGPDKTVRQARLVLGGVAPIPWRLPKVEAFLVGKQIDETTARQAATQATEGAAPLAKNGYKIPLTQTLVRRALMQLVTA
jgi:xanthine dehydrogenase YagS FAD-binding subunit